MRVLYFMASEFYTALAFFDNDVKNILPRHAHRLTLNSEKIDVSFQYLIIEIIFCYLDLHFNETALC